MKDILEGVERIQTQVEELRDLVNKNTILLSQVILSVTIIPTTTVARGIKNVG